MSAVNNEAVTLLRDLFEKTRLGGGGNPWSHAITKRVERFLERHGMEGMDVYAVKVVGPAYGSNRGGWAIRNIISEDGQVLIGLTDRVWNAEKCKTLEEAEELAVLLTTQKPEYLGKVRIKRLKPNGTRWAVDEDGDDEA